MRAARKGNSQGGFARLRLTPSPTLNNQTGSYTPPVAPATFSYPILTQGF